MEPDRPAAVACVSPWVPAEWIAAHGLRPVWLRPGAPSTQAADRRGVCPYAGAMVDTVLAGTAARAVVAATTCDQMRYAAAVLQREARLPVFLLNVPSTWQTAAAATLFADELVRLGRFLTAIGGAPPSDEELAAVMFAYDRARAELATARHHLSARKAAEAILSLRRGEVHIRQEAGASPSRRNVRLALVGGPLAEDDFELLDLIEALGGQVVLDATEGGERTLPAPFDPDRTAKAPLGELARAYFDAIPDAFRRPNDRFYRWLEGEIASRNVRGVVFHRYVWCDLWHAELARLKETLRVPLLELDAVDGYQSVRSRTAGRVEAFLEMLR